PLFVTWSKVVNGREPCLRGCIGTLEARCLINDFKDYALTSLYSEECSGFLQVGRHGMIIEFTDPDYKTRRSATYLPEIAAHGAGYDGIITESLRKRIHLAHYQSTLFTMHYGEYVAYVKNSRGITPTIDRVKP
ncbi:hypothetical protein H5410_028034, partial [Solanum commersonii]